MTFAGDKYSSYPAANFSFLSFLSFLSQAEACQREILHKIGYGELTVEGRDGNLITAEEIERK